MARRKQPVILDHLLDALKKALAERAATWPITGRFWKDRSAERSSRQARGMNVKAADRD